MLIVWERVGSVMVLFVLMFSSLMMVVGARSTIEVANDVKTTVVHADFNNTYDNYTVTANNQIMFVYKYSVVVAKTTPVRVSVSSNNASEDYPVMVVARQQETILSWQIPLDVSDSYSFYSMSRTLCPIDKIRRQNITLNQSIYITVSSMSKESLDFELTATRLIDFELQHETPRSLNVTTSSPVYYMYTFPKDVSTVLLKVNSALHTCMTVSVQNIKCPVFDLETNAEFEGQHQTMSTQAAMFLEKSDFGAQGGFYVVFIVKPNNEDCEGYLPLSNVINPPHKFPENIKPITVEIKGTISMDFIKD